MRQRDNAIAEIKKYRLRRSRNRFGAQLITRTTLRYGAKAVNQFGERECDYHGPDEIHEARQAARKRLSDTLKFYSRPSQNTKTHHLALATRFHVVYTLTNDVQRVEDELIPVCSPTTPNPVPIRRLRHPLTVRLADINPLVAGVNELISQMPVSMNFGSPPSDLKAVVPYLARATELRKKEPIIAYYCQSISCSLPAHWSLPDRV